MREKLFRTIGAFIVHHAKLIVALACILTAASAYLALTGIKLNSNLDELVSEKLDYHRNYLNFLKEFGDEEYLYIVVDAAKDIKTAKQFTETLGTKIKQVQNIKQVIWKIDNPLLEKNFLLYLTPEELKSLSSMMAEGPFAAKNISQWASLDPLFGALATRIQSPVSTKDEGELEVGFKFIDGLLNDMTASLDANVPYSSKIQDLFFNNTDTFDTDGFLKNKDLLFILIMPSKDFSTMSVIDKPLADIRTILADTKKDFPTIDAGLTGRPVLSADEMTTSNNDMNKAGALAGTLMIALFILAFRGIVRPVLAQLSLGMGIAWTFGFVALVFGTLNILSIVFAVILIGAVMEYAFRFVARYQEELSKCGNVNTAVQETFVKSGIPDITSAVATACAFLTLIWTDFTALAQLGYIAAAGVILCVTSILFVLPSLIVIADRRLSAEKIRKISDFGFPHIEKLYRKPWILMAISIAITLTLIPLATRVRFDNNLLKLQAQNLESVKYEKLIIERSNETTWFARAVADSIPASHEKAQKLRKLASVRQVDDVERILPEDQEIKVKLVGKIAPAFENISFVATEASLNPRTLMFELGRLADGISRLESQAFSGGRLDAVEELGKFSEKLRVLVLKIASADDAQLKRLGEYQKTFLADMQSQLKILESGMHPTKITLSDLPDDIKNRFVSSTGRFALFIYPKENIWDPAALKIFVDEIRSVDPTVIGTPIEVHESGKIMQSTFLRTALLALFVICIFVWFDTRSWRGTLLSIMPLCIGTFWLLGVMGILGIQFNMANFFAIPILIGTGIDFGIHLTHRIRAERSLSAIETSTGKGLMLTAISNALGFGSLMIASHHGIVTLGQIMLIGSLCTFLAAMIAMPPFARPLNWGNRKSLQAESLPK